MNLRATNYLPQIWSDRILGRCWKRNESLSDGRWSEWGKGRHGSEEMDRLENGLDNGLSDINRGTMDDNWDVWSGTGWDCFK